VRERAAQVLEHFDETLFVFADEEGKNHYD
jgi:hypothetical protein